MGSTRNKLQGLSDGSGLISGEGHVLEWIGDPVAADLEAEPSEAWAERQLKEAPARDPDHWARLARASGRNVATASSPSGDQG